MTYSESLAERVRQALSGRPEATEKKMFGGVGFLCGGNMCVGIWKTSLIARLGPAQSPAALKQSHVSEFDITGRPMLGWVLVAAEGLDSDRDLRGWIARALTFVETLPKKESKARQPRRKSRRATA